MTDLKKRIETLLPFSNVVITETVIGVDIGVTFFYHSKFYAITRILPYEDITYYESVNYCIMTILNEVEKVRVWN